MFSSGFGRSVLDHDKSYFPAHLNYWRNRPRAIILIIKLPK